MTTEFEITTPVDPYRRTVRGFTFGDYGVHAGLESGQWHVTHLPTGLVIARRDTRTAARVFARKCSRSGPPPAQARGIARATELGIRPGVPNPGCV